MTHPKYVRQKISAYVDGGPSTVSSVLRPVREEINGDNPPPQLLLEFFSSTPSIFGDVSDQVWCAQTQGAWTLISVSRN